MRRPARKPPSRASGVRARPAPASRAEPPHRGAGRAAARLAVALAIGGVAVLVHWPALSAGALFLDDQQYLVYNALVQTPGWASAGRLLGEVTRPSTVQGYYHPLPMLSLMLDYARGGRAGDLRAFHQTSLALHGLNTALVVILLYLLFEHLGAAAVAGLLFGVHPLTVESVVWLAERKTLLATFFALLALILYVVYARRGRWSAYGGAVAALALALLSKPTCTPAPLLLLLLDVWPLRRLNRRAILEKLPFFVVAAAAAAVTLVSQTRAASVTTPQEVGLLRGALSVCHGIVFYLAKVVCPIGLSAHYPIPEHFTLREPALAAGVAGTLLLTGLLIATCRWTRAALVGGLFFFVAVLPTMGLIGFTNVLTADKYTYFPLVGLLLPLSAAVRRIWGNVGRTARWRAAAVGGATISAAVVLGLLTRHRLADWQTTERIYRDALRRAPRDVLLNTNLAIELSAQRRPAEAVQHYELALAVDPSSWRTHLDLGTDLTDLGRYDEAMWHYQEALRLQPATAPAVHNNLGWLYWKQKRWDDAAAEYRAALRLDANLPDPHTNLGQVFAAQGHVAEAIAEHRMALRLRPDFAEAHRNLAEALLQQGDAPAAAAEYRAALRAQPDDIEACRGLARLLISQGNLAGAAVACRQGLRYAPQDAGLGDMLREAESQVGARGVPATGP